MFMHVGLEFPIRAALIAYRLKWRLADAALLVATVYEFPLRVILWFASTVTYVALCWKSHAYTPWEQFWRWAFPIIVLVTTATQVFSLRAHGQLYRKAARGPGAPSPEYAFSDSSNEAVLPQTIDATALVLEDSARPGDDSSKAGKRTGAKNEHAPSVERSSATETSKLNGLVNKHSLAVVSYRLFFLPLFAVLLVAPSVFSIADDGYITGVVPERRIVIVGGGIAGLGAAWAMKVSQGSNRFRVTVLDGASWLGGAALSAYGEDDTRGTVFLEHGFAAFKYYFCFELLLESLGVDTFLTAHTFAAVYGDADNGTSNIMGPSLPGVSFGDNRFHKFMPEIDLLDKKLTRALE